MNDLRLQLVGRLDVNATVKDINQRLIEIENKINKLNINIKFDQESSKKIEELYSKLKQLNNFSVDDKLFNSMKRQLEEAHSQIKKLQSELESLNKEKIKDFDTYIPTFDSSKFKNEINKTKLTINELEKDLKSKGYEYEIKFKIDKNGTEQAKQVIASIKDELGQIQKIKFVSDENGLFDNIEKKLKNLDTTNLQKIDNLTNTIGKRFVEIDRIGFMSDKNLDNYRIQFEELKKSLDEPYIKLQKLQKLLDSLNTDFNREFFAKKMSDEMEKAEIKTTKLINKLERIENAYKRTVDIGEVKEIRKALENLPTPRFANLEDVKNYNKELKNIELRMDSLQAKAVTSSRGSLTIIQQFKTAMERFPIWVASATMIYTPIRAVQDLTRRVVELDTALTELRRVMDAPSYVFNDMLQQSIENAKELGGLVTDYMTIVNEFARMGVGEGTPDEILAMSDTAQILANISDLTADESVNALIAAMENFNITAEESIQIADKLNEVDNQYSITTKDLALSLNKAASTAKTFGVTLDQLIGYTTAIGSSTRESGNIIGNSLKSIFSRITTNDNAISALKEMNISLTDSEGNAKSAAQLIDEVAKKWNSLTDAQRFNYSVAIAGTYQLSRWNALMLNYDTALKATETSINSQNSAMREQEKYADSLQARINRLDTAWTELAVTLGEAIISDSLISGIDVINKLLGGLSKLVNVFGALAPIGATFGAVLFALSSKVRTFANALIFGTSQIGAFNIGLQTIPANATRATVALAGLRAGLQSLLAMSVVGLVFVGIGFALEKMIQSYSKAVQKQEEFTKRQEKNINALQNNRAEVEELIREYNALNDARNRRELSLEEEQQYLQVQQKLGELFPALIEHIDTSGQIHLKNKDRIEEEIKATERLIEAKKKVIVEDASSEFEKLNEQLSGRWYESFSNFVYGSLEARIKQQKNIIESMYKNGADSGAIAKAEYELISLEQQAKEITDKIREHIINVANAVSDVEIDVKLNKVIEDFISKLDFSKLNVDELEAFSRNLGTYLEQLQKAITSGDSKLFNNIVNDINKLAESYRLTDEEIKKLNISFDSANKTIMSNAEVVRVDTEAYDELSEAVSLLADYVSNLKELSSASEMILGVSEKQVQETEKLIAVYQTLTDMAKRMGGETKLTAEQQNSLKDAMQKLSAIYPHLVENGELRIDNITAENKANRILLETYENVAKGLYTEEQKKTLASAEGTKARINNIIEEIKALQQLENQIMNSTLTAQQFVEAVQKDLIPSSEHSFYLPELTGESTTLEKIRKRIQENKVELDDLYSSLNNVTGTLNNYNTSIKETEKSSSKSTKSTEKSIYVTDKYRQSLEKLNLEIEKQQKIQEKFNNYSNEYRKALQQEIKLQQQKTEIMRQQAKLLEQQIKSGKIQQVGTATGKSSTTQLSGWNGRITSGYGYRTFNGRREFHRGIDIAMPKGTRLDANVSGKVIASGNASSQGYHSSYGNIVVIQDERGYKHLYAHLDKAIAKLGETIQVGQQIGTIGSTGRSTGSHLHYEINVNGKTIDPTQFIKDAKNGIVSVVNTGQEAIDKAKSELISIQSDILSQEQLILELRQKLIESYLAGYERRRSIFDAELKYEEEKIKQLDVTSNRYIKTVELMTLYMQNKQKVNNEELAYLDKLIKSGQYTGAMLNQLKDRYKELTTEILANTNAIRENNKVKIESIMSRYIEYIDDLNYALERSRILSSLMEEGSSDWNKEILYQIRLLEESRSIIYNQREELKKLLQTEELSIEIRKHHMEQLEDLSVEYWRLEQEIVNTRKELEETNKRLQEDIAEKLINVYKKYWEERQKEHIKTIEKEMEREQERHDKVMKNYKKELDSFRKNIQERLKLIDKQEAERDYNMQIDELEKERRKIVEQINLLSLDDSYEAKAKRKKLQEDLDKIDKNIAEKRHSRDIELQKESLNELLDSKQEQISKLEEIENERHEKEKERIDKEKKYWEQYYEDRINDEREFARIRKMIAEQNYDELEAEFKVYVEELKATMPDLEWTINSSFEKVGSVIRQNVIEELEEAISKMREFRDISDFSSTGSSKYAKDSFADRSSVGKTSLSKADAQVLAGKFLVEKLINQTDIWSRKETIKEKGYDLAQKGRQSGSTIPSNVGFDELISQLTDSEKGQFSKFLLENIEDMFITPALKDYIREYAKALQRLDTGGMIISKGSGVDGKGGKMAVLHPNEIVNNPVDSKLLLKATEMANSLMANINRFISPMNLQGLKPATTLGGDVFNFEFNGQIVANSKKDVEDFGSKVMSYIKRSKGGR